MTIQEMRDRIRAARDGIRPEIARCMDENRHDMVESVREQLYSGIDGNGAPLYPSYSDDPYFRQANAGYYDDDIGHWVSCFLHPERYVAWKMRITPPKAGDKLNLPPRGADTPNLFIVGTFHGSITAKPTPNGVEIFTQGWDGGPAVERKYGPMIFGLSEPAVGHFNAVYLMPALRRWYDGL